MGELSDQPGITGIMALSRYGDERVLANLDPAKDPDGLHNPLRAPTPRSMQALANLGIHGAHYYKDRRIDEVSVLNLDTRPASVIRIGGKGKVTGMPLIQQLLAQGIILAEEQIATHHTPGRLKNLPTAAVVLTATPQAEQIPLSDIPSDCVIADAGLGLTADGHLWNNTDRQVASHPTVQWTPPNEGVGPGSALCLVHNLLEDAGIPAAQMPVLGYVALRAA
ncbi:MAG TPA: hypothetical protein VMY99_03570 [Nevskiaceae bacterium]|nr:hypothetical protein [Nevskiaceae bacterium]